VVVDFFFFFVDDNDVAEVEVCFDFFFFFLLPPLDGFFAASIVLQIGVYSLYCLCISYKGINVRKNVHIM